MTDMSIDAPEGGGDLPIDGGEAEVEAQETEAAVEQTPEQIDAAARVARLALFEEKLTASREKRMSQRLAERAKAERKAAAEDRKAAAAERAKYDGLKEGSYKDTLTALGRDPLKSFEEMQREAIEYSTPEAAEKRARAELDEKFAKQQARIDALEKERADALAEQQERSERSRLVTHFQETVADPAFKALRLEYPDEALLEHAEYYAKPAHTAELRTHAKTYGIRLTDPQGRFTMHELLQVLSAAQAAHDAGKQARLAATAPPEAQPGKSPTVNGTAERRNAGTVTNELASARALPGPKASSGSVKDRLQQAIDEEIRRHSS
jgi:hypothetical protein